MPSSGRSVALTSILAVACLAGTAAGAETAGQRLQARRKVEARVDALEQRLASVLAESPRAEKLGGLAKRMLGLSRRFLETDNPLAAEIQADVAERLIAVTEARRELPAAPAVGQ